MTRSLELLSDAYDAMTRTRVAVDIDPSSANCRNEVRAESRLLDACIDAGMSHDEPVITEWAAARLSAWMVSGVECVA